MSSSRVLKEMVPGRGEYAAVCILSNFRSVIKSNVSWYWASVSPGNPTIISVLIDTPGISSRIY